MKIYYTHDEDGNITLGRITETHVVYEDLEVKEDTGDNFATDSDNFVNDSENFDNDSEHFEATLNAGDINYSTVTYVISEQPIQGTLNAYVNPEADVNAQVATNEKVSAVSEDENQQETSSAASFTESERAELETLKREKKVALIENYEKYLSAEQKEEFLNTIDDYSYETLEVALLKVFKEYQESQPTEEEDFSQTVPFAVPEPQKPETAESKMNSYIRRMLKK